jgi:transcriptional regulator with XRE-family HTH domain
VHQEQLSGLAGIARSHLAALESGEKIPRADTLWRIAEALSVRPSRLIQMAERTIEQEMKK